MNKLSRTSKYLIGVCVFLICFNAFLGVLLTRQSAGAMHTLIRERMLDISETAASMLDGDKLERLTAEDADTPEYREVLDTLTHFQDNIELEYIYCIEDAGDGNFVFGVDPTVEDPGEFGSPIVYTDALYQASRGISSVDDEPYEDEWGKFYSAYSPVFDSEHQVAGIVAVDFSASWYERQIAGLVWTTVIIIVSALFFSGLVILLIAARYREKFAGLFQQLNGVTEGIHTLIHEVTPGSEADAPVEKIDENSYVSDDEIVIIGDRLGALQERLRSEILYVRAQAYVDGLTGLGNRTAYSEKLRKLEEKIAKGTADLCVFVFDINGLKTVNDDYGHEEGDRIIVDTAEVLRTVFGEDRIFRIGGDEFVGLLEKGEDPEEKLTAFRNALDKANHQERPLDIFVSVGYSVYDSEKDRNYQEVFSRADQLMYADKSEFYRTHEDRRRRR